MSEPVKGDHVRVTFEGTVTEVHARRVRVSEPSNLEGFAWVPRSAIEKIEPPVEVFKPGDIVRHVLTGAVRALTTDGYTYLSGAKIGQHISYENAVYRPHDFTSTDFEKVTLS